jgi:DEAD/DEAH box helicase domain-containing protein
MFPTKALAQDQQARVKVFEQAIEGLQPAIYDGDTPASHRKRIRESARLVLTNPDMLHTGILPHHANWVELLAHLRYVIIDEMHTYRGIFGSHVANVLRRLKRIASFHGGEPQFILASATIGNPAELAARLIENPVRLVEQDGSGRGERHFIIYNPPVVEESLGLRKSAVMEAVRLSQDLHARGLQHVVFTRTRRSVEMILKYIQEMGGFAGGVSERPDIRGYRSGYLPTQRRVIEKGLRSGSVRTVIATSALELGIDIGGLEAALLVGYPGTIASARQQAGRAGRGMDPAAAMLIASASPIDQFLAHHPEYFHGRSPEQALIAPDHLLILLAHLRCAMFELPFKSGETFGGNPVEEFLEFLVENHEAHHSQDQYYWMADSYPAAGISLRSASAARFVLHVEGSPGGSVGSVDEESALWMVHPGAVYLHEAQPFLVEALDLEKKTARLAPFDGDYFTEPLNQSTVRVDSIQAQEGLVARDGMEVTHTRFWGELQVTTRVVGFRRLRWQTRESLGDLPLDLPATDLHTTGYWLSIASGTVERLGREGLWSSAPNDYGPGWMRLREEIRLRDGYRCQVCGRVEDGRQHDVHHKIPFRFFRDESGNLLREKANEAANLVTLCHECHHQAELNLRVRSGLSGLAYVLSGLAPLYLMCDPGDLGRHVEALRSEAFPQPSVVLYDQVPAGIGFSQKLFEMHAGLLDRALTLVTACSCEDGCPSCVGPGGENGLGGKMETLALLRTLIG